MKDVRKILITGLISAINTATGRTAYTVLPKSANISYPYTFISDAYQSEVGAKDSFEYEVDVLVQVVYKDVNDLSDLYTDMDNILSIVNNDNPFSLTGGLTILECKLNNSTTTSIQNESGNLEIGLIRIIFNIS